MAFITKSAIESSWEKCIDLLDQFGDKEIQAAGRAIRCIDQHSDLKDLKEEGLDRVSIFVYLFHLKNNENEIDEHVLWNLFYSIHIAFAAIYFTQYEYTKSK